MEEGYRFRKPPDEQCTRHLWVANAGADVGVVRAFFEQWGACEAHGHLTSL